MGSLERLVVQLPAGWVERPKPEDGLREFSPDLDGAEGILQVSEMAEQLTSTNLGVLAKELGLKFSEHGENWGQAVADRTGSAPIGDWGFAMFQGGQFPAMCLWVVQANDAAFLWSWLGPSLSADAVKLAFQLVTEARVA